MRTPQTPHFSNPFRFDGESVAVDEQDSTEEVTGCVVTILSYRPGIVDDEPGAEGFGTPDQTFAQAPVDPSIYRQQVMRWEDRVTATATEEPDPFNEGVRQVGLTLERTDA